MAGLFLWFAAGAYAVAVYMATRFVVRRLLAQRLRRWAWLPVAAVLSILPFVDELYNERLTRLACEHDGGLTVRKTITAHSLEAGMTLIESRRLDSEEAHYWRRELVFVSRPTGEELGRLRWFVRKGGWLRGSRPDTFFALFRPVDCPDPQPYLVDGRARKQLVHTPSG